MRCPVSELDVEATGSSVVCYYLSNYWLQGHQVVLHNIGSFSWLNMEHSKEPHPPLRPTCFREGGRFYLGYGCVYKLTSNPTVSTQFGAGDDKSTNDGYRRRHLKMV